MPRVRLLVDDIGMSEEIVRKLPTDIPKPPPPWSGTAAPVTATPRTREGRLFVSPRLVAFEDILAGRLDEMISDII